MNRNIPKTKNTISLGYLIRLINRIKTPFLILILSKSPKIFLLVILAFDIRF